MLTLDMVHFDEVEKFELVSKDVQFGVNLDVRLPFKEMSRVVIDNGFTVEDERPFEE